MFLLSGAVVAGAASPCPTANVLSGSNFEIDTDANLKVDGGGTCIDWLADGSGSAFRAGVLKRDDLPTGTSDDSFGQGTKEDDENPTIVTGSIPNNKSDLTHFGLYAEAGATDNFLELFWTRVQSPQGTTNMDFELNQKFCDPNANPTNCSTNGVTPLRTVGDKLITYDLANGGTVPVISIRSWTGSAWGAATDLTASGGAIGSINTSAIAATDSGGLGSLDSLTFGEAAISFSALFGQNQGQCGALGSAYLKSRSSDSFTAELKDFIAPEKISISNCTSLTTTATSATIGSAIHDVAHLSGATAAAGGTITFKAYGPNDPTCANAPVFTSAAIPVNGNGDYSSGDFTPSAVGTYLWTASYTGDQHNSPATTKCGDAGESSTVTKAPTSITTKLSETSGSIGDSVTDSSTLTGATGDAGGTVTYTVYTDAACSQNAVDLGTKTVVKGVVPDSNAFVPSAAGDYYFQAVYSGDSNNKGSSSTCTDEHLVIAKNPTSITTDAGGPYRLDSETGTVGLTDTATLSGATGDATGTIAFTLYGPDPTPDSNPDDDCTGVVVGTASATVDVAKNGVHYTSSPAITVNEPGVYHWVASYGGDNNNKASASDCGAEGENPLVIAPHITVLKTPDEQTVRSGNSVSWTIEVINDGSSTLTDVHVTDEEAPGCARTKADIPGLASMPPAPAEGSDISYTCTRDNNTASFTNVAVATGTPEVGPDVSAEDSAHVTVIHPAISVSKTPHTQTVAFAGTVTFTIDVKNTGDSVLSDVHVTDAQAPGCARTKADIPQLASMAPGDELSYSCTVANVMANFTNVAVAIGTPQPQPEGGSDVTATDSASVTVGPPPPPVTHPAISIVKNPKSQTVTSGGTATFTITVTNTGDVALTNVTVTDALSPNCNRTIGTLNPGQAVSYTCTRPNVTASFNNVAVATGTAGSKTVTAQDTAPVTAKAPLKPKKIIKPKVVSHKKPKATG